MRRNMLIRGWNFFPAAVFVFSLCAFSLPVTADDGAVIEDKLNAEMDRFGIRPASAGEETVTGEVAASSPGLVYRDKDGQYVLTGSGEKMDPEDFHKRFPFWSGIIFGEPPAASDGPVYYSGLTVKADFLKDKNIALDRAYDHQEVMNFSGSSRFGDDIGADRTPSFGFPGYPFGGPPAGTWIHYGRSTALISHDQTLINALHSGDFNTFSGLFEGEFDGTPLVEQFGDPRGF